MPLEATWMVLEIVRLHEVSQTEKEISYDSPYMWNLKKKKMNLLTKQKETRRLRNQICCRMEERGEEMVREFGMPCPHCCI